MTAPDPFEHPDPPPTDAEMDAMFAAYGAEPVRFTVVAITPGPWRQPYPSDERPEDAEDTSYPRPRRYE